VSELGVAEVRAADPMRVVSGDRSLGEEVQEEHLEPQVVPGQKVVDVDVATLERVAVDIPVETMVLVSDQGLPVDQSHRHHLGAVDQIDHLFLEAVGRLGVRPLLVTEPMCLVHAEREAGRDRVHAGEQLGQAREPRLGRPRNATDLDLPGQPARRTIAGLSLE
jgi:hypothetical protein